MHLDSTYVCNGIAKRWVQRWQRNGWKTSSGGLVANRDLWERLLAEVQRHQHVAWELVRGHSGVALNERAHGLVTAARLAV